MGDAVLSGFVDRSMSIEGYEGDRWPEPSATSTSLVLGVHRLRKRPIGELSVEDLRRLVGQGVGLHWLLPVALDHLRATAPEEAETGWYDDDLLTAVLKTKTSVWIKYPHLARHLDVTLSMLTDVSSYVRKDIADFRASLSDLLTKGD